MKIGYNLPKLSRVFCYVNGDKYKPIPYMRKWVDVYFLKDNRRNFIIL